MVGDGMDRFFLRLLGLAESTGPPVPSENRTKRRLPVFFFFYSNSIPSCIISRRFSIVYFRWNRSRLYLNRSETIQQRRRVPLPSARDDKRVSRGQSSQISYFRKVRKHVPSKKKEKNVCGC